MRGAMMKFHLKPGELVVIVHVYSKRMMQMQVL